MSNNFENDYKSWHQKLSFIKSGIRIAACFSAIIILVLLGHIEGTTPAVLMLSIGLLIAELIGILEEWF